MIGIVTNGLPFQKRFFEEQEFHYLYDDILHIQELHRYNLADYDTLILSCRLDIPHLKRYQSQLLTFIESGKRLIIFGEILDNWFPTIDWEDSEVNFSWWVRDGGDLPMSEQNTTHPLFKFITLRDMKWHYHGSFLPPVGAQSLLDIPGGRSLFYIDSVSFKGELVVTTLDPMFHIGLGFIDQSKPFLHGIAKWLREEENQ
ncbi:MULTISPECIES: hypothetical protein [Lysinibacillus]|uniref:Uncharacterized protein n=1 Tax=Lysinibacillus sphaericus TaxID=1421 RepID=A0A544UJY9_LYSSH|nr:hypothetical protein [Lysinibacillus sp. SDF0037]TQR33571.1 hypothetical protein C7Y47_11025 [Lysinibacillus sp. SDF0037]